MTDEELATKLAEYCNEVAQLREKVSDSSEEETLADLHARLIKTRQALDRVEAVLGLMIRMRGNSRQVVRARRDTYEDKLSEIMRASKVPEFTTAREREAQYDLGAFEEKRAWRTAEKMLTSVDMAYEFVQLVHRGLDGARRDIDLRVRIVTVEGRLER